jgi:predicted Zn-dependent protease
LLHYNGAPADTVLKTLQAIGRECPNNVLVALYSADIQIRMDAKKDAITTLSTIAPHIIDLPLRTKVLFQLGLLYFEHGNYTAMRTVLEQGKALNTNFLPLLNLLAHYYATKGNDIAQAQELIRTVHAQDQNNPHYLDTKALILYKQKEYDQACTLLEKLHAAHPHDATIALHLAKTVQRMGDSGRAKIIAQQATPHAHSAYEKTRIAKFLTSAKS